MSSVYHRVDKRSVKTYAYVSTSYRDPDTKKVRTHQTYLGRVDPVTGKLIPKAEGGRRRRAPSDKEIEAASGAALARIRELEDEVETLKEEIERMRSTMAAGDECLRAVLAATERYRAATGANANSRVHR